MDVWKWVYEAEAELRSSGQQRLADIIDQIPRLTVDGQHDQVEALVPEALALVRAIDHPWLEVFVRHWLAQSRVMHRGDVRDMDEIVRLLDFAHGERTAGCPQSICATQDFCSAYGVLDGPGFGDERVAATDEALARIDPTWPCFGCISKEKADALIDLGRFEEAERFCSQQLRVGKRAALFEIVLARADALMRAGRLAEARPVLERLRSDSEMKAWRVDHAMLKSRLYAQLERIDDAIATLPREEDLEPGDYARWLDVVERLCQARPERNHAELGATLRRFCAVLDANGALYNHVTLTLGAARLALARGRGALARLHLDASAARLPRLRKPAPLAAEHARLVALLPPAATVTDESAVLAALGASAEIDLDPLTAARAAFPHSEPVARAYADCCAALGFPDLARATLEDFVRAHPDGLDAHDDLMRLLVAAGDEPALRAMAEQAPAALRATAQSRLARLFAQGGRWPEAALAFEQARALETEPVRSTRSNLAYVYRQLGRLEEALALLDTLIDDPEDLSEHWDRMVVATLLNRHDVVRESAGRLGYKFSGEGPIDEPFAYCDVKIADASGRETAYRAMRINPVVARVIAMQAPGTPSVYRDEVLFEPIALNPRPEPPAEGDDDYVPVFRALEVLKRGGYRIYDLDGVHPGEAAVEALSQALAAEGIVLSVRSSEEYRLSTADDEVLPGVYLFIAVPESVPTPAVHRLLAAATNTWERPITYRGLLEELGASDELARHRQIAEELRL